MKKGEKIAYAKLKLKDFCILLVKQVQNQTCLVF